MSPYEVVFKQHMPDWNYIPIEKCHTAFITEQYYDQNRLQLSEENVVNISLDYREQFQLNEFSHNFNLDISVIASSSNIIPTNIDPMLLYTMWEILAIELQLCPKPSLSTTCIPNLPLSIPISTTTTSMNISLIITSSLQLPESQSLKPGQRTYNNIVLLL